MVPVDVVKRSVSDKITAREERQVKVPSETRNRRNKVAPVANGSQEMQQSLTRAAKGKLQLVMM